MSVGIPEDARRVLAAHWSGLALLEHASIASFSRFSLELMAVGAPAVLVEAAHRAALDEIEHARIAFRLASRYEGRAVGPGALPLEGTLALNATLPGLAASTAKEGCIGETVGAAEASALLGRATDADVRAALSVVARDEASHAELAWQTVRWALDSGKAEVRVAVNQAFAEDPGIVGDVEDPPEVTLHASILADHGMWPQSELVRVRRRALDEVVRPALAALLA
ncbi:MAG TPA: ferritin-like domain-containing protein [Polyangiaceae bacterium]|nr:ferritin-like domain-containing protein [Polyangiaceae bacterium]